ncbi:MAG: extracellular solute-binding protein [Anaerolineae bacterium]|nr:extracellular solute-binding protein [Anaerolineae bacterium]
MADLRLRTSRRRMLQLLAIGAGAAALAACAPKAAEAPVAPKGAREVPEAYKAGQDGYGWYDEVHPKKTVELLLWGPPGDETDPWIRAMKAAMERFNKCYPEIKTTWEPVPWGDLDTKVNAAVAARQGPDIVFEADREGEYPRRKVVREIPEEVLPAEYIKKHKFYEVRPLDDGKLYWVHCAAMGPILFVNKELLAKEGLKVSDIPKTWEDFGKFCQQLTKIEGGQMVQAGFAFNGYARYIWDDMMYQQKAHVYDKKKSFVNTPESITAWQMLVDMYDRFKVNDRAFLNFDEAFGTGKAAITQVWTWFGSTLEANYPDIDWAPAMYPTFDGDGPYGRFDYDGPGWMVSTLAEGEKMEAAWELFKYHCHEYQYLVERSHTVGLIVTTEPHPDYDKMFSEVEAVAEPSQEQRRTQALAVLARQFAGGMVFPGEVAAPFDDMWHKMEDAILLNQQPIREVLTEYERLYDEMLANTNFWITPEA